MGQRLGEFPQFKLLKVGKISPGKVALKPLVCTARVLILTQDLLSIYIAVTFAKCFIIILLAVPSPKQPMENLREEEPGPREEPKKTKFTLEEITPFAYTPDPTKHIYLQ